MKGELVGPELLVTRALLQEAEMLDLPSTVWARLEAQLARPAEIVSLPLHAQAALQDLAREGDPRPLALALLGEREMDGFTLATRMDDLARQVESVAPRQAILLPLLHQLEREGLVLARWHPGPRGIRRSYALRRTGRRVPFLSSLARWLTRLGGTRRTIPLRRMRSVTARGGD